MRNGRGFVLAAALLFISTGCTPKVAVVAPKDPITVNFNIKLDADVRHRVEKKATQDVGEDEIFNLAGKDASMETSGPLITASQKAPKAVGVSETVGEHYDGLVVPRKDRPSESTRKLVDRVNAERTALYEKRAKEEDVSVAAVGMIYAEEIEKNAPKGTYFLDILGKWAQK